MFNYNIPNPTSIGVVADWAELYISITEQELSKATISAYVAESRGSEPAEDFIDSVFNELKKRELFYGPTPPFHVEDRILIPQISWEWFPEYLACLIFSLEGNPDTDTASTTAAGKLFERYSTIAVSSFFNARALIYGHPDDQNLQTDISDKLFERFMYNPPSTRKDRNLDILMWKAFDDNRPSQLVILFQCAAGGNWKTKLKELNEKAWRMYIHFACFPLKGFTVPVVLSNTDDLIEHSVDAGIIFDRCRLYKSSIDIMPDDDLKNDFLKWCKGRVIEILG